MKLCERVGSKGLDRRSLKAVMAGRGDELIGLARANLWE